LNSVTGSSFLGRALPLVISTGFIEGVSASFSPRLNSVSCSSFFGKALPLTISTGLDNGISASFSPRLNSDVDTAGVSIFSNLEPSIKIRLKIN
jgi:hypothetical protein